MKLTDEQIYESAKDFTIAAIQSGKIRADINAKPIQESIPTLFKALIENLEKTNL